MEKSSQKTALRKIFQAYDQLQRLLKDLEEGYVIYDRVFTSSKKVKAAFKKIIGGEITQWVGPIFCGNNRLVNL